MSQHAVTRAPVKPITWKYSVHLHIQDKKARFVRNAEGGGGGHSINLKQGFSLLPLFTHILVMRASCCICLFKQWAFVCTHIQLA